MSAFEKIQRPPSGTFQGVNFMTPRVCGYWSGQWRGWKVYVELSQGRFADAMLYGVTVRAEGGHELWRPEYGRQKDPSRCFHSESAALEYINNGLSDDSAALKS